MIYKKIRSLIVLVLTGVLALSCQQFDYPNEDELELIEWNVTDAYSGGYGITIDVSYTDTTNLEKAKSDRYFYDFDMTHLVRLSELVLVNGKPLYQSYKVDDEYLSSRGGGTISLTLPYPLDAKNLQSISFDTSTVFYATSDEIWEVMGPNIDSYVWAKVRFVTESIKVRYQ